MAWKQLVEPNLSVKGQLFLCLQYADNVFSTPHGIPTAWNAWNDTQFKHTDQNFPNVAVPVWFSYYATLNGVYKNYGHVAVRLGNGQIYSSPYKAGTDHAVLGSIAELERIYGAKFVGWSEDISSVRVAVNIEEEVPMLNSGDVVNLYKQMLGRDPSQEEIAVYDGKDWKSTVYAFLGSDEFKKRLNGNFEPVTEQLFRKKG